jgi:HemY protein
MKHILILVFACIVAVTLGMVLKHYPGVMVVTFSGWRVDLPLWLAVAVLALAYVAVHYFFKILGGITHSASSISHFFARVQSRRAKALSQKGFVALAKGDHRQAERYLMKGAKNSAFPWLNYLCAANAAAKLGQAQKQAQYLQKAKESLPEEEVAFQIAAAQSALDEGNYDKALDILRALPKSMAKHPKILLLYQAVYFKLKMWEALADLIPTLKSQHILAPKDREALEHQVWRALLLKAQHEHSFTQVEAVWTHMPAHCQKAHDIIEVYVAQLLHYRKPVEAEKIIKDALDSTWDESLIKQYGLLQHPTPKKCLQQCEKWLKKHPGSSGLLLSLGRLSQAQQIYDHAQRYYEASLSLAPAPETYAALGALWDILNKPELSAQYYKKGLFLISPQRVVE